jgi:ribose transport system permease protein
MKSSGARKCAAILDCCYSGAAVEWGKDDISSRGTAQLTAVARTYGIYVLASSTEIQKSKDGRVSAFTEQLLRGIRTGDADTASSGFITLTNLFDYSLINLSSQMPREFDLGGIGKTPIANSGKAKTQMARLIELLEPRIRSHDLSPAAHALAISVFTPEKNELSNATRAVLEKLIDSLLSDNIDWPSFRSQIETLQREEQKRYVTISSGSTSVDIVSTDSARSSDQVTVSISLLNYVRLGTLSVILGIALILALTSVYFASWYNVYSMLRTAAISGILSCGSTLVIAIGRIDLTQGFLFLLIVAVAGIIAPSDSGLGYLAFVLSMLLGAAFGLGTGAVVNRVGSSALTTLVIGFAIFAVTQPLWGDYRPKSIDGSLLSISRAKVLGTPLPFIVYVAIAVACFTLGTNVLQWSRERLSKGGVVILCYIFSGMCTALASILLVSINGSASSAMSGWLYVPSAVAASVAGVYWFGGRWAIPGTILIIALKVMIGNFMILQGVSVGYQTFVDVILLGGVIAVTRLLWGPSIFRTWQQS